MGNIKLISSRGKKARRRTTAGKTALTITLIVLIGIVALTFSLGFYVDRLDTVFPNVWADGIKLSGMTLEEATEALVDAGYEKNAMDVSATISFPDGGSFTISGEEVGFALNAEEAALAAFMHGRSGSFVENEVTFIRSYFARTDLREVSMAKFDTGIVREVVAEITKNFNVALIDDAYSIGSDSIVIVVGSGILPADEDSVYELTVETLFMALEAQTHLSAEYTPAPSEADDVDLELLFSIVNVEAVSAVYDPATFGATESVTGKSFDLDAARIMLDRAERGERIVIPLFYTEPEVSTEELEGLLFRDVLAESTTRIAGTSNRLNNITIASEAIDGNLLNPGGSFSFNETVGRRTTDKGYREAGAYAGGRLVNEIGGGICQVSSTIYNCVLHADLEVVSRTPHGMTVAYLPLGQDATVAWGSIDFKFRNDTDFPLRIDITISGRDLTVQLIGTKLDDNYIVIRYERISSTAFKVIEKEDESVPQGQTIVDADGHTGHVVDSYKYLYDADDNLISKTLVGRSTYRVQDRVILIPIPPPVDTEQPPVTEPPPATDPTPGVSPPTDLTPEPPPVAEPAPDQASDLLLDEPSPDIQPGDPEQGE